jgi:hypothetical protein
VRLLLSCVVLVFFVGVGSSAFGAQASTETKAVTAPTAQPPENDTRQFADEIIRRLRRLGINWSKTRIHHPYDPAGDLC